jgi:Protein of unknown function (DUF3500)
LFAAARQVVEQVIAGASAVFLRQARMASTPGDCLAKTQPGRAPMHNHDHDGDGHGVTRRAVLKAAAALGTGVSASSAAVWAVSPAVSTEMAAAALSWLKLLDDSQRASSHFAFADPRRTDWHYVPRDRPGMTLGEMNPAQTAALWDLLGTLLSGRGLERVRDQLVLEGILGVMERRPQYRDPGKYVLVVFGDPAGQGPWSWRAEGHHLSLNTLVAPGHGVAVTPNFFGANPARVPGGHQPHGFRLLGVEEDAAFGLIRSLDGDVRDSVLIGDRPLGDVVAGPGREDLLKQYEGAPLSRLNAAQQAGVMTILQLYADTLRPEISAAAMARIKEAGVDSLHFAWAGSLAPGAPHYFRIHGPSALMEYDNTQNGANHAHSLWIDPQGLFGRDLLKAHYRDAH